LLASLQLQQVWLACVKQNNRARLALRTGARPGRPDHSRRSTSVERPRAAALGHTRHGRGSTTRHQYLHQPCIPLANPHSSHVAVRSTAAARAQRHRWWWPRTTYATARRPTVHVVVVVGVQRGAHSSSGPTTNFGSSVRSMAVLRSLLPHIRRAWLRRARLRSTDRSCAAGRGLHTGGTKALQLAATALPARA
jgi:hypothetical protein